MRVFPIAVLLTLAAACSPSASDTADTIDQATEATPLEDAVAHWSGVDTNSYLIRAIDNDRASLDAGCTWITEVHGAEVDVRWTAMFDVECGDWDVSVPALHDQVAEYRSDIDNNGGRLDVEWSDLGVPTRIDFAPAGGEGISLTIEYRELDDQPSVRTDLAAARSQWSAAGIGDYRLELVELTNYWVRGCRWTSVVSGGVPSERSVGPETNLYCSEIDWTVDVLFEMVSSWADDIDEFSDPAFGEHTLVASFDENGVPKTLVFDLANGADEETSLQISFTQLQG